MCLSQLENFANKNVMKWAKTPIFSFESFQETFRDRILIAILLPPVRFFPYRSDDLDHETIRPSLESSIDAERLTGIFQMPFRKP